MGNIIFFIFFIFLSVSGIWYLVSGPLEIVISVGILGTLGRSLRLLDAYILGSLVGKSFGQNHSGAKNA